MITRHLAACSAAFLLFTACASDPAPAEPPADATAEAGRPAFVPGWGVRVDGKELRLDDTFATTKDAIGTPAQLRDLGPLGTRFAYPDLHLSGMLTGPEDTAKVTSTTAHPGFDEGTAEKPWLGAGEATLRAELGEALRDPFLNAWLYRDRGVAFQMEGGAVAEVTVFGAAE